MGRFKDDVSLQELLEMRNEGYSNKEIAEALDLNPSTIGKRFIDAGYRLLKPYKRQPKPPVTVYKTKT